jgi:hypothetical protein
LDVWRQNIFKKKNRIFSAKIIKLLGKEIMQFAGTFFAQKIAAEPGHTLLLCTEEHVSHEDSTYESLAVSCSKI